MFLISTKPLRTTKTVSEYAKLLYNRFILEHFNRGVTEVHIVFDTCIPHGTFTPRQLQLTKRDNQTSSHVNTCISFEPNSNSTFTVPWQDIKTCKYSLVEGIGLSILQSG